MKLGFIKYNVIDEAGKRLKRIEKKKKTTSDFLI